MKWRWKDLTPNYFIICYILCPQFYILKTLGIETPFAICISWEYGILTAKLALNDLGSMQNVLQLFQIGFYHILNFSVRDLLRFIVDSNWELWLIMLWNEWSSGNGIGNDLLIETNVPWNYILFLNCLGSSRSSLWHWIWHRKLRKPVKKEDVVSKVSYLIS